MSYAADSFQQYLVNFARVVREVSSKSRLMTLIHHPMKAENSGIVTEMLKTTERGLEVQSELTPFSVTLGFLCSTNFPVTY